MNKKFPDDQWIECPSGELIDARYRLTRSRQRRQLLRYGSALTLMLGIGLGSVALVRGRPGRKHPQAQIACGQVHAWKDDYLAGRLDPASMELVEEHISHCAKCKAFMDRRSPS